MKKDTLVSLVITFHLPIPMLLIANKGRSPRLLPPETFDLRTFLSFSFLRFLNTDPWRMKNHFPVQGKRYEQACRAGLR